MVYGVNIAMPIGYLEAHYNIYLLSITDYKNKSEKSEY